MRTKPGSTMRTLVCLLGLLLVGGLASASVATAMPATDAGSAPSIASDKADYAPGELVTLAGTHWQPSESVHISVNDDAGRSWSRDVDVVADADGTIADSFNLPDWFVAEYSVRATGASGSVALASFTDGNLKVAVAGATAGITETLYDSAMNCSGSVKSGFPKTVTIPPTDTVGVGSAQSLRLDAPATANGGQAFLNWSKPAGSGLTFAPISGTNGRSVCVVGFQSGSDDIIANYAANSAPTVTAGSASVPVDEGQTANNGGSYADANPGDNVTISASRGLVTKTGTSSGTWSWSFATTDGPDQTGPVTITVDDGKPGGSATTTFTLNVANVAPAVTLSAANPLSVGEGATQQPYSYTISDPGADTVSSVSTSCGAGGVKVAGSDAHTDTGGSFECTFADGPGTSVVSASAADSDDATGNLATQSVTVANVAPTVSLTGPATADEGQTTTYSFTVGDPGQDTFSVDALFPDCDAGATNDGSYVAGSLSVDASGGSFQCFFADGPSTANVKIQVRDSDGASDTDSQSVQVVAVANVAPTVTAPADQTADEGAPKSFDLGSFADPGPDASWDVDIDWGDGSPHATFQMTLTGTLGTQNHTFADSGEYTVSVKVTDEDGASDSQSFTVAVANVAPTVTLSDGNELSVAEGSTRTYGYAISDPGADTVTSVSTSCGAHGVKVAGSDANTDTGGSFKCTFPDGPNTSTVSASATDSDDATGAADSQTVAVANVAPTVTLASGNDVSVSEGSTHTYGYAISDPGADTVASVSTSCGAHGVKVAGSDANTDTGGSFKCVFPDGPETSVVSASATDSDDDTGAVDSQTVAVANVAPTVNVSGASQADEGSTHTYAFTVSDPGDDGFDAATGYPDCDAGGTNNGSYVAGSLSVDASGGSFQCFFADGPSTANVKMKVADSDGASGTDSESVQVVAVANVAPTVTAPADQTADEGAAKGVELGSFADPGPDSPWAVDVDWGDGSPHATFDMTLTGTLGTQNHTYADSGEYTVSVKVTDKDGASDSQSFTVAVANVAPTVTLASGNDLSVTEGSTQTYGYVISDPGADTVASVSTSCGVNGDKVAGSDANTDTGGSFKCTFPDGPETSVVSASATDSDNATGAADSQTVAVANVAPTVSLSGASEADEGSTHTYTFTVSDPGDDGFDAVAGYPDCDAAASDNGALVAGSYATSAAGGTFECSFADGPSTANVKMKVADSDGASATDSESVQVVAVANVAPTVTAPADQTADEGAAKSFDLGSFADPGPDSPWAVDIDWGDGSTHTTFDATSTGSLGARSHTYADGPKTRTVTVKVTDENGDSDSKTFTVGVANVAPTAELTGNGPKPEGSPVTVSFTNQADPSSGDVAAGFRYGFACTASTTLPTTYAAAGTDASKSCTFLDNGTYVVTGRIFDRDNGYRSYDTSVTVTNVAPAITSFTGTNSLAGPLAFAPSTFKTDFTDPGTQDTWSAGFTWSTGLPSGQTVAPFTSGRTIDHTFTAGCNRTATVKVTDDDGDSDTKSTSVDVGTGTWLPPLADQPVSDKLKNGQVLPVKVRIADCNGVAVTGLAPVIQLVKGDQTAVNDDAAEVMTIGSVSAADTGTTMRQVDGSYMYNLRVNVASADLAKDFTIIIYPYGTGAPQTLRHVIVPTK